MYKNKKYLSSSGFTLIELLVVIAILGLLASIILVSLNSARANARDAKRIAEPKQVVSLLEQYYLDNGHYPIYHNPADSSANWANVLAELEAGGYFSQNDYPQYSEQSKISKLKESIMGKNVIAAEGDPKIKDPLYPDRKYQYMSNGTGSSYRIRVQLENLNNPILSNSASGPFLSSNYPAGATACDSSFGYYCIGMGGVFNP